MKNPITSSLLVLSLTLSLTAARGRAPADGDNLGLLKTPVASLLLEGLPEWTNKYGNLAVDLSFLNIGKTMPAASINRAQAVELQSQFRLQLKSDPTKSPEQALASALSIVKSSKMGRLDSAQIAASDFVVVFDLDETLYDQFKAKEGCSTYQFLNKAGKTKHVYVAPFANEIISRIHKKGGAVVLFSANIDEPTKENLDHWKLGSSMMTDSPELAGILYNSHLVRLGKDDSFGPMMEPSKDMRIFDESLGKAIIVDDNPVRLFQPRNHRLIKKFISTQYCGAEAEIKKGFETQLEQVWKEIEESVDYLRKSGGKTTFADAYLPYSAIGQVTLRWLQDANGWDTATAVDYLRKHPKVVDPKF